MMRRPTLRSSVLVVIVGVALVAVMPSLVAQQAPAPGSFLVPEGWTVTSEPQRAILKPSEGNARMSLSVYRDKREPMQVCVDFVNSQMKDKSKNFDVMSKKIFSYANKELARLEVKVKPQGGRAEKEWVLGVPVEGGTLLLVANMAEAVSKKYEPVMDRVAKSVLPKYEAKWHPVTNDKVGVRLMVAPLWVVDTDPEGKSNASPLEVKKGDALLVLSSKQDKRSVKDYVAELEKETKAHSKSYDKVKEERQPIAGVSGTRLDVKTTTTEGVPMREWLVVFARDNRLYLVKASAPEGHFEQYASDFTSMIGSVAPPKPAPPKAAAPTPKAK
jgi:hypothetical protein